MYAIPTSHSFAVRPRASIRPVLPVVLTRTTSHAVFHTYTVVNLCSSTSSTCSSYSYEYSSIGRRRTARLEFLGNLRTSQAGIFELRTILKITVDNSHAPHRTQDLLRVVDWQPNACTHFFLKDTAQYLYMYT